MHKAHSLHWKTKVLLQITDPQSWGSCVQTLLTPPGLNNFLFHPWRHQHKKKIHNPLKLEKNKCEYLNAPISTQPPQVSLDPHLYFWAQNRSEPRICQLLGTAVQQELSNHGAAQPHSPTARVLFGTVRFCRLGTCQQRQQLITVPQSWERPQKETAHHPAPNHSLKGRSKRRIWLTRGTARTFQMEHNTRRE